MSIVSQRYITLSASYKLFRKHIATHQRYRRLVQNLRPHLVHHIGIAGYTHVRYRRRERSSLHPGTGFGLLDVTVACILSPLCSLICLHRLLRFSTLRVCTGNA